MAKFYVKIIAKVKDPKLKSPLEKEFTEVINANNEMDACVGAWIRLRLPFEGSSWKVSEIGDDEHDDDIYFGGQEVKRAVLKFQKKRGDPD